MLIGYRGNFAVPFSTESHVSASMEALGHTVIRLQENEVGWADTVAACERADVFWWTTTFGMAHMWPQDEAHAAVGKLNGMLPTVGHHLDLWCGLDREHQLASEPYFRLGHLWTADGDHDDVWAAYGINHYWLPPAVYHAECQPGRSRPALYRARVGFVGSWRSYHGEWWPHRKAMLDRLSRQYRRGFRCWPLPGRRAVRGEALNDLLATVEVTVGDSCMANTSIRYFSDRPFETVGRGGFLVMPRIPALAGMLEDGEHCAFFTPGDWDDMCRVIDRWLADPKGRARVRAAGQAHVRDNHTYMQRVQTILDTLAAEGAL